MNSIIGPIPEPAFHKAFLRVRDGIDDMAMGMVRSFESGGDLLNMSMRHDKKLRVHLSCKKMGRVYLQEEALLVTCKPIASRFLTVTYRALYKEKVLNNGFTLIEMLTHYTNACEVLV